MRRARALGLALIVGLGLAGSCRGPGPAASSAQPERASTASTIALGNLEAMLRGVEQRLLASPDAAALHLQRVDLLLTRARYLARFDDLEAALASAECAVELQPSLQALAARARVLATCHRFREALADLDRLGERGLEDPSALGTRASILQATGRSDEALLIRRSLAQRRPDLGTLGTLAVLLVERGEVLEARRLFGAARASYRDVSPLALAWLDCEEGRAWLEAGDAESARAALANAVTRVPEYVRARVLWAEALEALGRTDAAIAALVAGGLAFDPEVAGHLMRLYRVTGDVAAAARMRDRAAGQFDELVAVHPGAFADHAAEFWLYAGDAPRALALAERNYEVRPTARSRALIDRARVALGQVASR